MKKLIARVLAVTVLATSAVMGGGAVANAEPGRTPRIVNVFVCHKYLVWNGSYFTNCRWEQTLYFG